MEQSYLTESMIHLLSSCQPIYSAEFDRYVAIKGKNQKERMIKIMEDFQSGDAFRRKNAENDLLIELHNFILIMIRRYAGTFKNEQQDLLQECNLAVIDNMHKFDPTKGTASTFFTPFLRHAITVYTGYLTNRSSAYYSTIANKVRKSASNLTTKGMEVNPVTISYESGLTYNQVEIGLQIVNSSNEAHFENSEEMEKYIPDRAKDPEQEAIEQEGSEILQTTLNQLPERLRTLFCEYHGIYDKPKSYAELAKEYNMTVKAVSTEIEQARRMLERSRSLSGYFRGQAKHKTRAEQEIAMLPLATEIYDSLDDE